MAAPVYDFLDAMMWSIVASGVLLGIAALRLHYKASSDSIEEEQKNLASGLGVALGATGLYLFLTGIYIQFIHPFSSPYNILFGGVSSLGGLVMLSVAAAFFLRRGLQACSYFAFVLGLYLISDAYSIYKYSLTSNAFYSTLLYLAPAVALLLSVPAVHIQNRWSRVVFAIFAFVFAGAWFYFAATTTPTHLG